MSAESFRFAAVLSTAEDSARAVDEVCTEVSRALGGRPDLLLAFYTHHYGPAIDEFPRRFVERLSPGAFIGCTGESIVGNDQEIETSAAVALWGARLGGVSVTPMHLTFQRTPEGPTIGGWPDATLGEWPAGAALIVLGEPFTFPADWLLERLNDDRPRVPVVGGMASGGHGPGQNRVAVGRESFSDGAAAVLLHGPIDVRTVVSQGCRPIGEPLVITKADQQMIQEVGGRKPLEYLQELFQRSDENDRRLMNGGLHVGRVISEYRESFGRGDFLIRNCVGLDRETGGVAVADFMRRGQTVQFHVRDAASADEDLKLLLTEATRDFSPQGGLLFTCNGRGTRLFDGPHHDAAAVRAALPDLPLAGLFAQGECGPVGGKNFLHGFTASLALFAPGKSPLQ